MLNRMLRLLVRRGLLALVLLLVSAALATGARAHDGHHHHHPVVTAALGAEPSAHPPAAEKKAATPATVTASTAWLSAADCTTSCPGSAGYGGPSGCCSGAACWSAHSASGPSSPTESLSIVP